MAGQNSQDAPLRSGRIVSILNFACLITQIVWLVQLLTGSCWQMTGKTESRRSFEFWLRPKFELPSSGQFKRVTAGHWPITVAACFSLKLTFN